MQPSPAVFTSSPSFMRSLNPFSQRIDPFQENLPEDLFSRRRYCPNGGKLTKPLFLFRQGSSFSPGELIPVSFPVTNISSCRLTMRGTGPYQGISPGRNTFPRLSFLFPSCPNTAIFMHSPSWTTLHAAVPLSLKKLFRA